MSWLQVSVAVAREQAQAAGEVLESHGAVAVSLAGADSEELLEPAPGEQPLWQQVMLHALMPAGVELKGLRADLEAVAARATDVAFVGPQDWQNRWRVHAVRACFGGRLWVLPRDEPLDADAPPGAVVLRLDPGLAFGSGSHPTTRLCLAALAELPLAGARVLDYGCGSGILAIAACLLGAAEVVAVDHDPQALIATRDNAAENGVSSWVEVLDPGDLNDAPDTAGCFDLVIANILANPLVSLAPRLSGLTRVDGRLVLSGLLADQQAMILAAYPRMQFDEPVTEDGWIRLDGRHRGAAQ